VEKYPLAAILLIVGVVLGFGTGYVMYSGHPTSIMASITARGYILVGTNTPYPPFEVYNATTHVFSGFEIELMERVAAYMGLTVQWNDMAFDALVGACKAGTVDVICAAMFLTPQRAGELAASTPYLSMNEVVVVKNSSSLTISNLTEDLNGKIVGVQTGTVEDGELTAINSAGGTIDLRRYTSADLMFTDLNADTLDALYIDEPVYAVYNTIYTLKTIFTVEAPPICAYARPDGLDLLGSINLALYALEANGTISAMVTKYLVL